MSDREVRVFLFRRALDVGFAEIRVERFDNPDPSRGALDLCERVLRPHNSLLVSVLGSKPEAVPKQLGGWDGIEVNHRSLGMVVRAAVIDDTEGYAVSLRVEGDSIDDALYHTFDAVCESVSSERARGGNVISRDPRTD